MHLSVLSTATAHAASRRLLHIARACPAGHTRAAGYWDGESMPATLALTCLSRFFKKLARSESVASRGCAQPAHTRADTRAAARSGGAVARCCPAAAVAKAWTVVRLAGAGRTPRSRCVFCARRAMEVDDAREARTPHTGSAAHPLAAMLAMNRSPLTPGGVGVGSDLFSPRSVLVGRSGLQLVLPKGACAWRAGGGPTSSGGTDRLACGAPRRRAAGCGRRRVRLARHPTVRRARASGACGGVACARCVAWERPRIRS